MFLPPFPLLVRISSTPTPNKQTNKTNEDGTVFVVSRGRQQSTPEQATRARRQPNRASLPHHQHDQHHQAPTTREPPLLLHRSSTPPPCWSCRASPPPAAPIPVSFWPSRQLWFYWPSRQLWLYWPSRQLWLHWPSSSPLARALCLRA